MSLIGITMVGAYFIPTFCFNSKSSLLRFSFGYRQSFNSEKNRFT